MNKSKWFKLCVVLAFLVAFVALATRNNAAFGAEVPPEARAFYDQRHEACKAEVILLFAIDGVANEYGLVDLPMFKERMIESGNIPEREQETAIIFAELYYNSVKLPWLGPDAPDAGGGERIELAELQQFVYNTCTSKLKWDLDEYMREHVQKHAPKKGEPEVWM